ncbi:coiled-coil domain-containing protein 42 like-2-like [Acanthopagrus latus]|uniref:coiled-coil domain-containing protein 42 like-2-like n=1 Tax=Acanthopagrus latus TaxID=8177 RepID=UPI00187C6DE6|nr:coiled-coil domain-containing protein 42 like-2-like [Acanthopagrus latus]
MNSRTVRQKQRSRLISFVENYSTAYHDLQKKDNELDELIAKKEEKTQTLLKRIEELNRKAEEVKGLCSSYDMFVKHEEICRTAEKTEEERKEGIQKDAEIKRLKEEYVELMERNRELQRQVQSHRVYRDVMERAAKMRNFDSAERFTGYLASLLPLKEKLYQRNQRAMEQDTQQRMALRTLEDRHRSLQLQKNNQLSQLDKELKDALFETQTWENNWIYIVKTTARESLFLGQIKMATLNLYDMSNSGVKEEEAVDVNDTETQLDKIVIFLQDHEDILKWHQISIEKQQGKKGTENKQGQKPIAKKGD